MTTSVPPEAAPTIASLVAAARGSTPEEFELILGRAVLVGPPDEDAARDEDDPWAFNTVSSSSIFNDRVTGNDPVSSFRDSVVFGIRKARPGPFADTILVGRSSSNDICVPHPSLSKLHARIRFDRDEMVLSDSGSKNGTQINGRLLDSKESVVIHHGDEVQFGARAFKVYATARLHTVLSSMVPT